MDILFLPTSNVLINTFLRSMVVVILCLVLGYSWYTAYWAAVVHDILSLWIVRPYV